MKALDYYSRLYPPQPTRFVRGVPERDAAAILDSLLTEDGEAIVGEDDEELLVETV